MKSREKLVNTMRNLTGRKYKEELNINEGYNNIKDELQGISSRYDDTKECTCQMENIVV